MSEAIQSPVSGLHHRLAYIDSNLRHALDSVTGLQLALDDDRKADGGMAAELYNLDRTLDRLETCMQKIKISGDQPPLSASTTSSNDSDSAEKELLLQALDAQEYRIRQLEDQLRALSNDDDRLIDNSSGPDGKLAASVLTNDSLKDDPYAQRMIVTIQDDGNLKIALSKSITTIGREPGNDIQIRSRFVSRFHARIVSDQDGATVEDLDSRNGVSVNAEQISRKQLRSGDFIKIGRVQLQYIDIMEGTFDGGAA
jgi:hypothetical protein